MKRVYDYGRHGKRVIGGENVVPDAKVEQVISDPVIVWDYHDEEGFGDDDWDEEE